MNKAIYDYEDYRGFLKQRFQELKKKNRKFSYQFCGNRLKTSKNYIKLILDGKRHTSLEKITAISKLFQLDNFESQYLLFLFLRAVVTDPALIDHFEAVLGGMKRRKKIGVLDHKESAHVSEEIYANWEKWLVHSMVRLKDFDPDPATMRSKILEEIPVEKLRSTFEQLKKSKLIEKRGSRWDQNEFVFTTPSDSETSGYQIFQLGLKKASEFIAKVEKFRPNQHYMMTVAMDNESFEAVRAKFVELRNFIIEKSKQSKEPDKVFFTCNHIFGVTAIAE